MERLEQRHGELEEQLKLLLLPDDPNDRRNVILEVRAGTGGEEAALFAAELLRMYTRYAEDAGWRMSITDLHEAGLGGIKEAVAVIEGERVYSRLKYESGVHRVQRVPATEASGRIHTSAATVAVLPEAEEVEIEVEEKDLRDRPLLLLRPRRTVRQHHLLGGPHHPPADRPRGPVPGRAVADPEPAQGDARAQGAALGDRRSRSSARERAADRRSQVGSGDRSEKIRTYNFPQTRVTDHRIGLTVHRLQEILDGDLDVVLDPLLAHVQAERLKEEIGSG